MALPEVVLKTQALSKTFTVGFWGRRISVLNRLDLEVHAGEVFGFLGPNGAGKTTTLKILVGLVYPTSGKAWLFGREIGEAEVNQRVGFLPEAPYFYEYLTAEEFLRFHGQLFGLGGQRLAGKVSELLQMVRLSHAGRLHLRKFSKGMLQRIGIAQALINDPDLVILDEPMSGLDPIGRKEIRDLILSLKQAGKTIIFSSHILHDAELLCDRVGMLIGGRLVACGRIRDLMGNNVSMEAIIEGLDHEALDHISPLAERIVVQGDRALLVLRGRSQVDQVLEIARVAKATLLSLIHQRSALEDLFIRHSEENGSERRDP